MNITYLGHSSFKLQGKEGTVVTDPFDPKSVGLDWKNPKADIVTLSHQHGDHNNIQGVKSANGDKGIFIIDGPGEYEVSDVMIHGWATYHDGELGTKRGKNTIYSVELDRVRVLHCGDLGHELSENLIEEIGQVDVLLIPVGGHYTIDAKTAAKITKTLTPGIVIPMHYQTPGLNPDTFKDLTGADEFLKEMGTEGIEPQDKLNISQSNIPDDTQIVLLTN